MVDARLRQVCARVEVDRMGVDTALKRARAVLHVCNVAVIAGSRIGTAWQVGRMGQQRAWAGGGALVVAAGDGLAMGM